MTHEPEKRRLKGLDEMPLPRRTLRQRYFRAKYNLRKILNSAVITGATRLVMMFIVVLVVAKVSGYPVEKWILGWAAQIRSVTP